MHYSVKFDAYIFIQSGATDIFTKLGEMTDADKIMNPQHFGSDPADIRAGLIRQSGFESQITVNWNFGVGGGLRSLSTVLFVTVCNSVYLLAKLKENRYSYRCKTFWTNKHWFWDSFFKEKKHKNNIIKFVRWEQPANAMGRGAKFSVPVTLLLNHCYCIWTADQSAQLTIQTSQVAQ